MSEVVSRRSATRRQEIGELVVEYNGTELKRADGTVDFVAEGRGRVLQPDAETTDNSASDQPASAP